jgi:hypothetical protein
MPGPGNKPKSKKKGTAGASASIPTQSAPLRSERSLAQDIEHAFEWDLIALTVCEYFNIPGKFNIHEFMIILSLKTRP